MEKIWYKVTVNTFTPCQEKTPTIGQSNPLLIIPSQPSAFSLQSPGCVELRGRQRSAVCSLKVPHVLPCLGDKEKME